MIGEKLTQEWREEHVRLGDRALTEEYKSMAIFGYGEEDVEEAKAHVITNMITMLINVAQAHYQAANVRAKPLN